MREILSKLNKINGVRGSMLINRDGIVVASDFSIDVEESSFGAVASSVLSALEGALKRIDMGTFSRFVISGSENKLAMVNTGQTILLVLLNRDANTGLINLELKEAAFAIQEKSKM
ncbi:MAG: roadblock/LC7 domain-containing protein [Planctomycetota bacterium]